MNHSLLRTTLCCKVFDMQYSQQEMTELRMLLYLVYLFLGLLVVFLLQLFNWISPRTYWYVSKIQGPKGLPVLGVALTIRKFKDGGFLAYIDSIMKLYDRIAKIWVLGIPIVLLKDPKDLEILLPGTTNIKKGVVYQYLASWLGDGLLLTSGSKWKSRRKMLTPAFHFRILEENMQTLNKNSVFLTERLLGTEGEPLEIRDYVKPFSLDAICETAMGVSLDTQKGDGQDYVKAVLRMCKIFTLRNTTVWLLKDWMFFSHPLGKEFKRIGNALHNFVIKIIEDRVQILNNQQEDNTEKLKGPKPFLDNLIEYRNKSPETLSLTDIRDEVNTFMFAGYDTTSTSISYTLFLLASFQDIQDKVVEELYNIFGDSDRSVDSKDVQQMCYMEKVIKESLRYFPPIPLISRTVTEDLILADGTVIPPGVHLIIPTYSIHRQPQVFPEPERFDPERFSEENIKGRHPMSYIPFSAGPRNCIGQKFALVEIKVALATVLRRCKLEAVTMLEDVKVEADIILTTSTPMNIKCTPRVAEK